MQPAELTPTNDVSRAAGTWPLNLPDGGERVVEPVPDLHRMLAIPQVAECLGVTERFVRRIITERRITFHRIGRHIRFSVADVEAYIAASRVEAKRRG